METYEITQALITYNKYQAGATATMGGQSVATIAHALAEAALWLKAHGGHAPLRKGLESIRRQLLGMLMPHPPLTPMRQADILSEAICTMRGRLRPIRC